MKKIIKNKMNNLNIINFLNLKQIRQFNSSTNKKFESLIKDKWQDKHYELNFQIINEIIIRDTLNKFKESVMDKLEDNDFILLIFKIKIEGNLYRNISNIQRVNKLDFNLILEIFLESWQLKLQNYKEMKLNEIIFRYLIIPKELKVKESKIFPKEDKTKTKKDIIDTMRIGTYNLPNTTDINKWGEVYYLNKREALVYKFNSIAEYHVKIEDKILQVDYKIKDKTIFSFTDELLEINNLETFTRKLNNYIYNIKDGTLVLKRKTIKLPKIKKLIGKAFYNDKILVMDLETQKVNNKMIPYTIGLYDGTEKLSFYLSDYNDDIEMLTSSIKILMRRKYQNYKIFFHNFSVFDGVFLLRILTNLSDKIRPIIKDGDIIDLVFKFGKNTIYFRDSYLLLPASLKDLTKSFKVTNKGIFPYFFLINTNNPLDYIGPIPEYKYFSNITVEEYNKKFKGKSERYWKLNKFNGVTPEVYKDYCNQFEDKNNWNLREESIKYCLNDCVSLYEVLLKFSKQIFELFRINVIKYPTLSSLAFAIYRTKFMKEENIPIIMGKIYNFIKLGYYGGAVDVYKPYGKNIYRYDVNSLYPYAMKTFPMPIGNPTIFEGDITQIDSNAFGLFEVDVKINNLNEPILLTKIKKK
jgi:hypothetical protein